MFTITPTGKRDAWSALDNELLAHRLRKRETLRERASVRLDNTREEISIWLQELIGE